MTPERKRGTSPVSISGRRGDLVLRAYEGIGKRILSGQFLPGQRLSQDYLSQHLGIGRTPLREALRLLEGDGLVVSTANAGVTVARPQLDHTEQLYAIRFLVEPPVVSALVDDFSTADLEEMDERLAEMEAHTRHRHNFQQAHLAFHLVALKRYGEAMEALVLKLYRRVEWHQRIYMSTPRAPEDFIALDRALLQALRDRSADETRALLQLHLLDAALGIVLDVEPDHRFGPLLAAASGSGVTIDTVDGGIIRTLARIDRVDGSPVTVETANLYYVPGAPDRRRRTRKA